MLSFIFRLLNKVPQPWKTIVIVAALVVVIVLGFYLFGQIQSCRYDKSRKEYAEKEAAWLSERTKLIADAEVKEKRIAELEPQVLAYKAAADAGKKVDDQLAAKIEGIGKEAANEEARATEPVDCRIRAARVCELLRSNRIPHDCPRITAESCSRQ